MAAVLDATALAGVALQNAAAVRVIGDAIEQGRCYITVASLEEFACITYEQSGMRLAEKWVGWLYTVGNIGIVEAGNQDFLSEPFVTSVAEAYSKATISVPAATAAALARHMGIPVITNRLGFSDLERIRFCEVRWTR